MTVGTPQPSVLHLLTIFRQISAGQIRIPAFQREFVWKDKQIIGLLESVRAGYPIGSMLLWHVEKPILRMAAQSTTSFPVVDDKYPTNYVLDGMQRLSSLYGVFHYGSSTSDQRFNVWFDLEGELFVIEKDIQPEQQLAVVPLAALFAPRALLLHQARLTNLPQPDLLFDRLIGLQSAFQDYMIPVVQIRGEDVEPIVKVFESINSTGTTLGRVDFMRAITWAQDFDLSLSLDATQRWLETVGFTLAEETVVKCIGMLLNVSPSSESLLALREKSSQELEAAFRSFEQTFKVILDFLREDLNIYSIDFVPYEGQVLILFKALGIDGAQSLEDRLALKRWFWASSFNESLRGKPDHYVVRAVNDWRGLVSGDIRGLEPRLRLVDADFLERRLIKRKALSTAFIGMFAASNAKSLRNSSDIPVQSFMRSADASMFVSILSAEELSIGGLTAGVSTRLFANVVLDPENENRSERGGVKQDIISLHSARSDSTMISQFIDIEAASLLEIGDYKGFLDRRAHLLRDMANQLVETGKMVIA